MSDGFIAEARAASAGQSLPVEWRLADMRHIGETAAFDAAFCLGNSFAYLDHPGNIDFLRAVSEALRPGGRFVLHTGVAAESILPAGDGGASYEFGGIHMYSSRRYEPASGQLHIECTFTRDGVSETRGVIQQVYSLSEITRLLAGAGLAATAAYGSLTREPFRLGSPQLFVAATKPMT